jgi:hypothetical protein
VFPCPGAVLPNAKYTNPDPVFSVAPSSCRRGAAGRGRGLRSGSNVM